MARERRPSLWNETLNQSGEGQGKRQKERGAQKIEEGMKERNHNRLVVVTDEKAPGYGQRQ